MFYRIYGSFVGENPVCVMVVVVVVVVVVLGGGGGGGGMKLRSLIYLQTKFSILQKYQPYYLNHIHVHSNWAAARPTNYARDIQYPTCVLTMAKGTENNGTEGIGLVTPTQVPLLTRLFRKFINGIVFKEICHRWYSDVYVEFHHQMPKGRAMERQYQILWRK